MKIETLQKSQKEDELRGPISRIAKSLFGFSYNERIASCKEESISLFSHAKKSIMIVSGILNHEFYNDQGVVTALKKAINNKVRVEIITGPEKDIDKESKEILSLYEQGKIKIWSLPERLKLHFSVVDEKHVRLEYYHDDYKDESRAIIERDTIATADKQAREFIKLKQKAELLKLNQAA